MARIDEALATFLLNSLWQVALVAGLTSGLIRPVRSSAARHGLWAFSLMLGLMLPMASVLPRHHPDPRPNMRAGSKVRAGELGSPNAAAVTPEQGTERSVTPQDHPTLHLPPGLSFVLTTAYALFLISRLGLAWRAWRAVRGIRESAMRMAFPEECGRVVERCRVAFGLAPITIASSSKVRVPVAIGARSPMIALPDGLLAQLSIEELTAILGHEMAHIRRRDIAMNLVYELLYLPVSFHPAAVFMKRRVATSREQACDDLVIGRLMPRLVYARSLVSIAARVCGAKEVAYGVAVADERSLESRIQRLLAATPGARWWSVAWAVVAVSVLSLCSRVGYAAAFHIVFSAAPAHLTAMAHEMDSRQLALRPAERRPSPAFGAVEPRVSARAPKEERPASVRLAPGATSVDRPSSRSAGQPAAALQENVGDVSDAAASSASPSTSLMPSSESAPVRESVVSTEYGETSRSLLAAARASETWEAVVRDHPLPGLRQAVAHPLRHDVPVFKTKKRLIALLMVGVGGGVLSRLDYEHEGRLRWERHAGW